MKARIRKLASDLGDTFWLVPALMVLGGIVAGLGFVAIDHSDVLPAWLVQGPWLYNGGATGARTLLGAIASSTIGVAGTVFAITIAALSLAAGQMGPRLLRNFTRDRGNQFTLGVFLGTFSYALMVLRSVRTEGEGAFVPHLSLSVGILLAILSVATLVYFVGHMAGRINVDTVIDLVSDDVRAAISRLTSDAKHPQAPPASFWSDAVPIIDKRRGYLQQFDDEGLADWAAKHKRSIRLLVRPGDYVFPGAPIAAATPEAEGVSEAIRDATALGAARVGSADLEFAIAQLVEVAVRALSPGINDPNTAISVINRLGEALCDIVPLHLPTGVYEREGTPALVVRGIDYDGLTDTMFHMIRQNARGKPAVLIRLLDVLTRVLSCERDPERMETLQRHADLVIGDAERDIRTPADLADIQRRYERFLGMREIGPEGEAKMLFVGPTSG
ncbi:MAG: DUF2254 domain-containing protein [Hyphomicrobium sp.]